MTEKIKKPVLIFSCIVCAGLIFLKVDFMRLGGFMMFPIILSSLFASAVIFAKIRQFFLIRFDTELLLKNIFECIERQRIKEAIDLCDNAPTPIAHILKVGIMKYDCSKDEIKAAMESSFLEVAPIFEDGLTILFSIIQIIPLLGFIGVAIAMVHIFQVMQANGMSFAGYWIKGYNFGAWEALLCPLVSLVVATVLLIAYNYLTARANYFIEEAQKAAMKLFNFLLERRESFNV